MKDRKLAVRYARALLSAIPDAAADATEAGLSSLAEGFAQSSELRDVLLNPSIARPLRIKVLEDLAQRHGMPQEVKNFLVVLEGNGRIRSLDAIARVFREEKETRRGIVAATVTTATPLTPDLERRASAALEKLSGMKVNLQVVVDPALIGGMIAQIGSMVYDGSLKSQLARLRRRMAEE